jgi:hypothetical protein
VPEKKGRAPGQQPMTGLERPEAVQTEPKVLTVAELRRPARVAAQSLPLHR